MGQSDLVVRRRAYGGPKAPASRMFQGCRLPEQGFHSPAGASNTMDRNSRSHACRLLSFEASADDDDIPSPKRRVQRETTFPETTSGELSIWESAS